MGAAEHLVGRELPGRDKKRWTVVERLSNDEDQSGMFHSIGYKVKSGDQLAFMKVTDLELMTDDECSMLERMHAALQAHSVERQMLEHCKATTWTALLLLSISEIP